jgi:hypothetical protein
MGVYQLISLKPRISFSMMVKCPLCIGKSDRHFSEALHQEYSLLGWNIYQGYFFLKLQHEGKNAKKLFVRIY